MADGQQEIGPRQALVGVESSLEDHHRHALALAPDHAAAVAQDRGRGKPRQVAEGCRAAAAETLGDVAEAAAEHQADAPAAAGLRERGDRGGHAAAPVGLEAQETVVHVVPPAAAFSRWWSAMRVSKRAWASGSLRRSSSSVFTCSTAQRAGARSIQSS